MSVQLLMPIQKPLCFWYRNINNDKNSFILSILYLINKDQENCTIDNMAIINLCFMQERV